MACSASGQDEGNPALWLAARAGKIDLSCPLGISCFVPAKAKFFGVIFWPYNKSFIDQTCLVKMAGYWPCSFLRFNAKLWHSKTRIIIKRKRKTEPKFQVMPLRAWVEQTNKYRQTSTGKQVQANKYKQTSTGKQVKFSRGPANHWCSP